MEVLILVELKRCVLGWIFDFSLLVLVRILIYCFDCWLWVNDGCFVRESLETAGKGSVETAD